VVVGLLVGLLVGQMVLAGEEVAQVKGVLMLQVERVVLVVIQPFKALLKAIV
jgi:hypothetical protein